MLREFERKERIEAIKKPSDTLVMIPAYNEGPRIREVIEKIRRVVPFADILVINDGSTDDTLENARNAGVTVAPLPYNLGYGVAVQTGYKYAARHGYRYVVQMDADGQHEPECIPDLLNALRCDDVDVAMGSRWLGVVKYDGPWLRKFGKHYFGFIASLLIRQKVTDPTTGFQALSLPVVEFFTSNVYPADYPDADVIIMLHRAGFKIREVPVAMYRDDSGQSMHSGFKPIYYGMKMMMSIVMTLLRDDRKLKKELNND